MALNDLLAALEAREGVTPATPRNPREVPANPAPFRACTLETSDTPGNDEAQDEIAADLPKHFAALDAAGNRLRDVMDADAEHRKLMLADWQAIPSERWPLVVGHLGDQAARHAAMAPLEPVSCGACRHFIRDGIGDGSGVGTCRIEAPASQDLHQRPLYPGASRLCRDFDAS